MVVFAVNILFTWSIVISALSVKSIKKSQKQKSQKLVHFLNDTDFNIPQLFFY